MRVVPDLPCLLQDYWLIEHLVVWVELAYCGAAMRSVLPSKVFFIGMFTWSALAVLALALPT